MGKCTVGYAKGGSRFGGGLVRSMGGRKQINITASFYTEQREIDERDLNS